MAVNSNVAYGNMGSGPLPNVASFRQPPSGVYSAKEYMTSAGVNLPPVTSCMISTPIGHHSADNQVTSSNTPTTPDESEEPSSLLPIGSHLQQAANQLYEQQMTDVAIVRCVWAYLINLEHVYEKALMTDIIVFVILFCLFLLQLARRTGNGSIR